ncbi:hypothetical protein VOLCADRAFT_103810 [Volvox carteri f. nagariensis]|uniref:Uncharacterized protein n=1 Tax=Volvox carteri f. nagariensis TaxID=3068 RepID=D8TPC3_VOLCA|nr:uncharacterized protein VOLCADRAFT_103810 [Volvox carteri f. nagariensis]EFJ50595.1 hypothetical protein VOLCADRAFT_103810 [Volvox carteri f. nagariensis]|eukprot:XP_002948188.1 hypothetical protein VOLCADRAFT_103810 [Volvox carteri f. nagariensis]
MTEKEAEKRPEDDAEEDDEEDSDEERSDAASTSSKSSVNSVDSSSKKKKKKKKKKKGKGSQGTVGDAAQAPQPAAQPGLTKAQKAEAEKRFAAALDACRGSTEMWVKLAHCNIFDAKAKKLADALRTNSCITCLDLSGNNISDEGAQALAAMLSASGAPELIELDLRDNPLTPAGTQAMEAVFRARKQLVVKLGPLNPPAPEKTGSAAGVKDGVHGASSMKEVTKGPMFRKFFQTGDDDDDTAAGQGEQEGPLGDGGLAPEELWSEVKALVAAGTASIPKLSSLLQRLIAHLNRELGTLQVPHTDAAVDGSRPHIKGCIMNLDTLGTILDMVPRQVTMQYVSEAQPAVGSHRVWATEIVSMLLAPNHTAVDNLVAASKLVPRVLALSLAHPMCSALHTRALRVLRSCCVSKVAALYGPLFTAGMGAGLTAGEGSEEPCGSLQQQLAHLASPSLGIPSGRRDPLVGFVLEACKVLRACCDEANRDSILNINVRRLLLMDPQWSDFVSEGGVLGQLCKEQEGDLGGPRAARVQLEDSNELAELAGGGLISSHEILALLHGMNALGMQTSSGQ